MPHRLRRRTRLLPARWCAADGPAPHAQPRERLELDSTIRPATAADRDAVVRLYVQLKRHHHDLVPTARRYRTTDEDWEAAISASMTDPKTEFFVAEEDGSIVAFMRLRVTERAWGKACEIDTVVVSEEVRNRSIGRGLMEYAEQIAADRGATGMRVNVLAENEPGRRFYERLGYTTLAHRLGKELGT